VETPQEAGRTRPRGYGLVILIVVLIGVAAATAVLVPLAQGQSLSWANLVSSYDWLVAAIIVILVIALLLYVSHRTLGFPDERRERRRHRHSRYEERAPSTEPDPAVAIARARYARGEISSEQLNQLISQLGRSPGPPTGR
jgi:uncharacterized membrane protein